MTVSLPAHRQPSRPGGHGRGETHGQSGALTRLAGLPTPPPLQLVPQPEGLLQIHTAPFRGSMAAVFSQALRTAGLGSRVLVSQFLRGGVEQGLAAGAVARQAEHQLRPATPQCIEEPLEQASDREAAEAALAAVLEVWRYSREQLLGGSVDLLVLDELGLAIELGYLQATEVAATLERRPAHLDVIVTGPSVPAELMAMADQVTQLRRGL